MLHQVLLVVLATAVQARVYNLHADCKWYGKAPACDGTCPSGWLNMADGGQRFSARPGDMPDGFGSNCWTGGKAYCCPNSVTTTTTTTTQRPPTTVTTTSDWATGAQYCGSGDFTDQASCEKSSCCRWDGGSCQSRIGNAECKDMPDVCSGEMEACCSECQIGPAWDHLFLHDPTWADPLCNNYFHNGLLCPNECNHITGYWVDMFRAQGIRADHTAICLNDEGYGLEWFVHGMPTCVASGGANSPCTVSYPNGPVHGREMLYCAGGAKIGWSGAQVGAVEGSFGFRQLTTQRQFNRLHESCPHSFRPTLAVARPSVSPSTSTLVTVLAAVGLVTPVYALWRRYTGNKDYHQTANAPTE